MKLATEMTPISLGQGRADAESGGPYPEPVLHPTVRALSPDNLER